MTYTPFDLTNKVALVTGGNGGIGLGIAKALAQAGADVAIWGTNADKNAQAAERLRAYGIKVYSHQVDISVESDVIAAVQATLTDMGRIDALFANAGIAINAPSFADMDTETYRKNLSVNLDGSFWTMREVARHMVARAENGDPGGSLVGVASIAAVEGAARNQAYAATKGGMISMIKGIAVEYGHCGIRANAILPGWIATDMTSPMQKVAAFTDRVISRVPTQRWGEPSDFGGIAVYLASDASRYHTGDLLVVDGGYSIF